MNADMLFSLSSTLALGGWICLSISVLTQRFNFLRDTVARLLIPFVFAGLYTALIAGFFMGAKGGYNSLSDVAALFETREILLAGWIHYLAFDLFVGSYLAERGARDGMPRLVLLPILATTFLFGPAGLLAYFAILPFVRPQAIVAFSTRSNPEPNHG
ncbi:ABA4-like family protein [Pararhizobium antarcticum]|uniref:ABA4-like family protein n=1 Tax=Pararhizobium antarcticum TaxID=1798805 RepID=UPI0008FFDC45|nr:ABA4-like family protein [Pararhizobium antarcticum]